MAHSDLNTEEGSELIRNLGNLSTLDTSENLSNPQNLNYFKYFDIHKNEILGRGAFGVVCKGRDKRTGIAVAGKRICAKHTKEINSVLTEIKNLNKVGQHPFVVSLLDFEYSGDEYWLFMEYCDLGDLDGYVKKHNPNLITKLGFVKMLSEAVAYMHGQDTPVVHRDIKLTNIMVMSHDSKPIVKVSDFGVAKIMDVEQGQVVLVDTNVGTPGFKAPEVFAGKKYTVAVDVWGIGLVLLTLVRYDANKPHPDLLEKANLVPLVGRYI